MPIIKVVEKLWGRELWHHNDHLYCMKTLILHEGAISSLHYHPVKHETFLVINGEVALEIDRQFCRLYAGDSIDIPATVPHRFRAVTPVATVVEASTMHDDSDVVRLEESRAC